MDCPNCSHNIEDPNATACPACSVEIARSPYAAPSANLQQSRPPADIPGVQENSVPFEDRSLPFFDRLWKTILLSITNPRQLFSGMRDEALGPPILYVVIIGTVAGMLGMMWQIFLSVGVGGSSNTGAAFAGAGLVGIVMLVFLPLMLVLALFIWSGIYHGALLLFGVNSRGFGITLRAVAYGYGTQLLAIIPICGGIVGGIWYMVLVILGAMYGHRTDGWRAAVGYFLPFLLCCGIFAVVWFMVLGIAATQAG